MIRFEVDPTLVADAIRDGRKLWVEVDSPTRYRAILGQPTPHKRRLGFVNGPTTPLVLPLHGKID